MPRDDKRRERENKRSVKREGQRRARRELARGLRDHPEEAQFDEVDFGTARSQPLNGPEKKRPSRAPRDDSEE